MNTNETNTNDNGNPNDPSACERARDRAALAILPALLSLLSLARVTAALEWCALYVATLAKGRDDASEMHEASIAGLAPDVRAICDVILACVLGHTALDALGGSGEGAYEAPFIARALGGIAHAQRVVTGLAWGERDRAGATDDATALDVRERAMAARRRGVLLAVFATVPEGDRFELLSGVEAWVRVLGGLATAAAATDNPTVRSACEAAAYETASTLCERDPRGKAHPDVITACSGVWFGAHPLLTGNDIKTYANGVTENAEAAVEDLAHVRALLSRAA